MRYYCADCTNWDRGRHLFRHGNKETDGCTIETGVDENHPIAPKTLYLNYAEANKDGDCEHYGDKLKGLGLTKDANRIEFATSDDLRFAEDADEKEVDET